MKTILLVDDEYALAETLMELLAREGYRVVSAANGKDGISRLKDENPALVITDFMMPISDGKELIRRVRGLPEFRSVPILLMSATTEAVALSDRGGAPVEASAFLQKPFSWEELRRTVKGLIGDGEPK